MNFDTTVRTGTPTRTSTAAAVGVALLVIAALLAQVDLVVVPALVGAAGACTFAASLWLVSLDDWETVTAILASLLTVPVALGLTVGTLGTVLTLVGAFFPVQNTAALSVRSLLLISRVGIVIGCLFAVLGVLLGIRNVVDAESLTDYYWLTLKTGVVPGLTGGVLIIGAFLAGGGQIAGHGGVWGFVPADLGRWLLAPTGGLHLATLFGLLALAVLSVRAAIGSLPVAELLADRGAGETEERRVEQVRSVLGWLVTVALFGFLVALVAEFSMDGATLRDALGPSVYRPLATLSTAPLVRSLLVLAIGVALPTVAAVRVLRRAARSSVESFLQRIGPFIGGAVVTAIAFSTARQVLAALVEWTASQLPGAFGTTFQTTADQFAGFFGAPALVVTLAAVLVAVTATVVLVFRFAVFAGYLSQQTAGYSLAAGGLFVATAFAGTVGAPAWLVFGGLVGSLFVWDVGQYGTTLGEEIGRHAPTRDAELVHAGGTLAVGLFGTAVAYGVGTLFESGGAGTASTDVVALLGVLVGIVFLVTALR